MRPDSTRLLATALVVGTIALGGCSDSARPTGTASATDPTGPSFTAGAGIASTTLARANAGSFHVQSKYAGFDVELKTHDNADVVVASLSSPPGGYSGWHSHPGPALVTIKAGALTIYSADDPTCSPKVYPAGSVLIEVGGHVHFARNEGSETAEWVTTYIVPAGGATRVDAPAPGNCPF